MTARRDDWRAKSACGIAVREQGVDPDLWTPTTVRGSRTVVPATAALICQQCTTTVQCARLALALTVDRPIGVWAGVALGTDPDYRAKALERIGRIAAQPLPDDT